jgi:hypothetical protein
MFEVVHYDILQTSMLVMIYGNTPYVDYFWSFWHVIDSFDVILIYFDI